MTRTECENKILEKLNEIGEIALKFNPRCTHLSMYVINGTAAVWCTDYDSEETILDARKEYGEEEGAEE